MQGPLLGRVDLERRDAVLQQPPIRPAGEDVWPDLAHAEDGPSVVPELHDVWRRAVSGHPLRGAVHTHYSLPIARLQLMAFLFSRLPCLHSQSRFVGVDSVSRGLVDKI